MRIIGLFLLLAIGQNSLAQADSAFVEFFPKKFSISPFVSTRNLFMILRPKEVSRSALGSVVEYRPNVRSILGVGLFYRNIGLNLALQAPNSLSSVDEYGETDYVDLGLKYAKRKIIVDLYYKDYQGFADFNTKNYTPNTDKLTLRGDLELHYWKVKGMYLFNGNRYSYKSAFNSTERQRKSVSSWLLISHVYRMKLESDSAIIPTPIRSVFEDYGDLEGYKVLGIGFGGGFTRNFVLGKKFAFTPLLALGFDIQNQEYFLPSQNKQINRVNIAPLGDLRVALGYNSEKFVAGITFTNDLTSVHFPKLAISHQYVRFDISVGFRFNPPNFMKAKEK